MEPVTEIELVGGSMTPGIVRVGDTVRRPRNERSGWISQLLTSLEDAGYQYAPRFRGIDDQGRDTLTYIPGTITNHPSQRHSTAYRVGGRILRQLHELTADHHLISEWSGDISDTGRSRCIVHGDPGAYNTIFQAGIPAALIDWDTAHPGDPVDDLAFMAWAWCIQSAGNVPVPDQARHLRDLAAGYEAHSLHVSIDDLLGHITRVQQNMVDTETGILADRTTTSERRKHAQTAITWATADQEMIRRHRIEFATGQNDC